MSTRLGEYLLFDLQVVHVVIALHGVLLGVCLGINQHVVFVPAMVHEHTTSLYIHSLVVRLSLALYDDN